MTADVIDLATVRARRFARAAERATAKAATIAKAQPQARACSLAPLEPVADEESWDLEVRPWEPEKPEPLQ
jgi:hypothetical protein